MAKEEEDDKGGGSAGGADMVPSDCSSCGLKNESDAKFCKGCGASLAMPAGGADDDDDDDEADEDDDTMDADDAPDSDPAPAKGPPPPPGKKGPPPPPPAKGHPPPPQQSSSLAGLAGLHDGASTPAIKSALIPVVGLANFAMRLTETRTPSEARGALTALAEDAAAAGKLRGELRDAKRANSARERMELGAKLASITSPGEVYAFDVDAMSGKKTKRLLPQYAEMKLSTFRGLVDSKLKNAGPAQKRSPFEPDATKLESLGAGVTAFDRDVAARHGKDPKDVAASRNALMNQQNRALGARGV